MKDLPQKFHLAMTLLEGPAGFRRITEPADVQLAERSHEIAESEGVSFDEAMTLARRRDPELASRYHDRMLGDPRDELVARVTELRRAAPGVAPMSAAIRILADDPELDARIAAYFEPATTP